jgi:predicted amidohydrolase
MRRRIAKKRRTKLRVALVQLDVGPDREDNLDRALKLIARAAKRNADIVCLPELFSYMGSFARPKQAAEPRLGLSISTMRKAARDFGLYIVAGSILERAPRGLPLNTCYFIGPSGRIISRYSKLHLFDIDIAGKIHFHESKAMQTGRHITVVNTPFGMVGFAICNDLRYPEIFRKMALAGARIIFVPSAFTKFTGRDHWIALNRVRAIENQCYIIAVNQSGKNISGVRFFGSSIIVDPWGKVLREGPPKGDAIITCDLNLLLVDKIRRQLPALKKVRRLYPIRRFSPA